MSQDEFIDLYFQGNGSDKVYQASLEATGNGDYIVRFAFGRNGTFLREGTKTPSPQPYGKAKKIYDKLVNEKLTKGYTSGARYKNGISPSSGVTTAPTSAASTQGVNSPSNFSGILPQLLNFISEEEALELIENNDFIMQEKKDGKRTIVKVEARIAKGINKKGSYIGISQVIAKEAQKSLEDIWIDGEDVNCKLWVFDLLKRGNTDLSNLPYLERLDQLAEVVKKSNFHSWAIELVKTAKTTDEKRALFSALKEANAEGVVFKRKDAPYVPGRPSNGGDQLKFKFYATASVLVSKQNPKHSVAIKVLDGMNWVDIGNVTIPVNHDIPAVGTVIEVRYLYAYEGGSLYQPQYLGKRDDTDPSECTISQLKYKPKTARE
jgi:bifunctional non-homologous end joining protein LigD